MRNWLTTVITATALSGCVSNGVKQQFDRYTAVAAEPTPTEWKAGAVWTFVTVRKQGVQDTRTFKVTDTAASTCVSSGDWRELELLEGDLGALAGYKFKPAALVKGRNLWISLTSNWCDINNDIKGELTGGSFNGHETSGGMMGETPIGPVTGRRIK